MREKYRDLIKILEMDPRAQQKTMCKNISETINKCSEPDSQVPKSDPYFRGGASWEPFAAPIRFLRLAMGLQRLIITQEMKPKTPKIQKLLPKVSPFRDQAWRTARYQ